MKNIVIGAIIAVLIVLLLTVFTRKEKMSSTTNQGQSNINKEGFVQNDGVLQVPTQSENYNNF